MKSFSKLLCSILSPLVKCPCRYESGAIKGAGGKWAEMLDAKEGEYFWKKNQEYLDYIKAELKKGRTMNDIIEEHKQHLQELHAKGSSDDDSDPSTDRRHADYIKKEVEKGRPIEDVIKEVKEKIKKN